MDDLDRSIKIAEDEIQKTGGISRKGSVNRTPPTGRRHSVTIDSPEKYEDFEPIPVTKQKRTVQLLSETVKKRYLKEVPPTSTPNTEETDMKNNEWEENRKRLQEENRLEEEQERNAKDKKRKEDELQSKSDSANSAKTSEGVSGTQVSGEPDRRTNDPQQSNSHTMIQRQRQLKT